VLLLISSIITITHHLNFFFNGTIYTMVTSWRVILRPSLLIIACFFMVSIDGYIAWRYPRSYSSLMNYPKHGITSAHGMVETISSPPPPSLPSSSSSTTTTTTTTTTVLKPINPSKLGNILSFLRKNWLVLGEVLVIIAAKLNPQLVCTCCKPL